MKAPVGSEGRASFESSTSERPEAVRIWLLGGFRVSVGSRTIDGGVWRLRKAAALVKLLALSPGHRLLREQIMDLLWPDSGRKTASNNLRRTLHAARKVLDPHTGARYLASEDESLVLCPNRDLWVDVEGFEDAAATAHCSHDPAAYRTALDLYSGELLPGDHYEGWAEGPRRRMREAYLSLLLGLACLYEERGDYQSAIEALRSGLVEEPTREEAHVGLMRVYAHLGSHGEALAQYSRLEEVLLRELGTEPTTSSRTLKEKIAAGRFPPKEVPSPAPLTEQAIGTGKHNLPAARTTFVGREREMLEVKRALAMTRLLTLTGAGGSGKSRLALEIAKDLIGTYSGGVWLVELAPLSEGELVPQAVAGALGVLQRPGEPLTETLIDTLQVKNLLLIIDNCEHLIERTAQLVDLLLGACSRLRVLATSREALNVEGEVKWLVPPLSAPDPRRSPTAEELETSESARLFLLRARNRNSSFTFVPENAQSAAQICRQLGGIPLAIELAAARVGTLSAEEISERLEDSLGLLSRGPRTAIPRQRTLRAALDWSYILLSEAEKQLFRRLSVFAGGWTLEAPETLGVVGGVEQDDILDLLSGLVDKSLVTAEGAEGGRTRYRMLEPIRQYALEKLEESGEVEDTKLAHALHFLDLAEEAESEVFGPGEVEWFDRLEGELDNIRVAFSWMVGDADPELGLRLAGALRLFWYVRTRYGEWRGLLEEALTKGGVASPAAQAKALVAVGWLAFGQGDLDRIKESAKEGLRLSEEAELGAAQSAIFYTLLGHACCVEGDFERATMLLEEGLALSREADDAEAIVYSLTILVWALAEQEDYEQAKEFFEEGLALSQKRGNTFWRRALRGNFGMTFRFREQGDLERAAAFFEEDLALEREAGDKNGLASKLSDLAEVEILRGDLKRARALYEESLTLSREIGSKHRLIYGLEGLTCVAGAEGESLRAARLFGTVEALREATGIPLLPSERTFEEPYVLRARSQLGAAVWEEAFAEGKAMTLEQALEYALLEHEGPNAPDIRTQRTPP
jgi:predicted ATPase/DNA-binding SARP family transcriptional activator